MDKQKIAKELVRIAKGLVARKPIELMTPDEFSKEADKFDAKTKKKLLRKSLWSASQLDCVLDKFDENPGKSYFKPDVNHVVVFISARGKRKRVYTLNNKGHRQFGLIDAPETVTSDNRKVLLDWLNSQIAGSINSVTYVSTEDNELGYLWAVREAIEDRRDVAVAAVEYLKYMAVLKELPEGYIQKGKIYTYQR